MALELSQVFALRAGNLSVPVGRLAKEGVEYLRAKTDVVKVSSDSVRHFYDRGRTIDDFEIITMSYGITHGLFIADPSKPNHIIVSYEYPDTRLRYKIVVKSARQGEELWVSTLHKQRPRQTKAMLCRGSIIKRAN